ncbi:MAG: hypothetical protein RMJ03_02065 [Nitrososphaerota archaeon]|nr:hypothetical protein [Nitrososphaerota archaeon]
MYEDIFKFWKRENESSQLEKLPPDFYLQVAEYLKKLREEERMIDRKTLKASLLRVEMRNVKRLVRQLIKVRYKKLMRCLAEGDKISYDSLAIHERNIIANAEFSFANDFKNLFNNVLTGHFIDGSSGKTPKTVIVRFLKEVPAIIGADMKAYGPFKCEDVASLPLENANILIKQKLAERIEV